MHLNASTVLYVKNPNTALSGCTNAKTKNYIKKIDRISKIFINCKYKSDDDLLRDCKSKIQMDIQHKDVLLLKFAMFGQCKAASTHEHVCGAS